MTKILLANPTRFDNLSAMTTNQTDELYVEYLSPASCEEEFMQGGTKWIFCWAKYSNGKRDLGVYSFAGDVVYAYQAWREKFNLN